MSTPTVFLSAASIDLKEWRDVLHDAFSRAGVGFGYTHGHSLRLGFSFLRIDHILASSYLAERLGFVFIDRNARKGTKPSDHAPVLADFDI